MKAAGHKLRHLREQLGFNMRDVESASSKIAAQHGNDAFYIPLSRLSDIEKKGITPSIYRFYTLSVVYRRDLRELLSWYGIDVNVTATDLHLSEPPRSHLSAALASATLLKMPLAFDPGFDSRHTTNFSRMIQQWGIVPVAYFSEWLPGNFTYGYIGTEDFTMYPLLLPGSFVQIDEKKAALQEGMVWRSEYERPIYFVETRNGFVCSWCSRVGETLILQSHPLSPVPPRSVLFGQEAEILGQVVGVAMRLDAWGPVSGRDPVLLKPEAPN